MRRGRRDDRRAGQARLMPPVAWLVAGFTLLALALGAPAAGRATGAVGSSAAGHRTG
jgi:hypothetical protein